MNEFVDTPTPAFEGELGEPAIVLSLPEMRHAELLETEQQFDTVDGFVTGHPGEVAITGATGERWPVHASVFYGTYEVIGRIGRRLIARRLVHPRRAWPVISENATFNYGERRGTVVVERGSWLYQSDDNDFGTINASVMRKVHAEVGSEASVLRRDWRAGFDAVMTALAVLPVLLALIALMALWAGEECKNLAQLLLLGESVLLMIGALLVWRVRRERWGLRSAVRSSRELAAKFEVAARLLGHPGSQAFPSMNLWRGAQTDASLPSQAVIPKEQL
ncbi:MAG TPA: hypothetical protein VKU41_20105, partial [Polyangiaceae bacterium]|nr:hypothetical protein [Polyangiaceae bacterium]